MKEFRKGSFWESVFSCKLRTYKQGSSASKLCENYQAMQRQANLGTAVMDDSQSGGARSAGEVLRAESLRRKFLTGNQEITPLDGVS